MGNFSGERPTGGGGGREQAAGYGLGVWDRVAAACCVRMKERLESAGVASFPPWALEEFGNLAYSV